MIAHSQKVKEVVDLMTEGIGDQSPNKQLL